MLRRAPIIACLTLLVGPFLAAAEDAPDPATARGTPFLGVKVDLAASETVKDGVVIRHVYPGSTAAAMGVLVGDVVMAANGQDVRSREHLVAVVDKTPVGQPLSLRIRRGEQVQDLSGTMLKLPHQGTTIRNTQAAAKRIAKLEQEISRRTRGDDDISLAMAMQNLARALNTFPDHLQQAAKEFKRVYPKGRFAIRIEIDITTDATDEAAVDLSPGKAPEGAEKLLEPKMPSPPDAPSP